MKYRKFAFMLSLLISSIAFAQNSQEFLPSTHKTEDKIYLSEEEICLYNKQIFARVNGSWYPTNQLHCDASGIYVQLSDDAMGFWTCNRCGKVNYPWYFSCEQCGNPK